MATEGEEKKIYISSLKGNKINVTVVKSDHFNAILIAFGN